MTVDTVTVIPVSGADADAVFVAMPTEAAASSPQHANAPLPSLCITSSDYVSGLICRSESDIELVYAPASEREREWAAVAHNFALANSQDGHAKVGCAVLSVDGRTALGTNRLPAPIRHSADPSMLERPDKYDWITHAERDAIYEAVTQGISLHGATVVVTKFPCHECLRTMGCLGVRRVVSPHGSPDHPRWGRAFIVSRKLMECWGMEHAEVDRPV